MSRFLKVMIVLLAVAAMAMPAMAADNFSVSGEFKALGFYLDNGGATTDTGMYQRLRVQGTFKATDNVSATFRTDFSEGNWGSDTGHGRFNNIKDMDRAYADVKFDAFDLRIGTQYFALGKTTAVIANDTGAKLSFKGFPVTVFVSLLEDNDTAAVTGTTYTDSNGDTVTIPVATAATSGSDAFLTGVNVAFGDFNVFLANENDGMEEDVYVLGATYAADYDAIRVVSELNYFTGDASATVDAMGLQFWLDASMAASETATVGAELFYAQGTDDATEAQYTRLGNAFGTWDPLTRGPYNDEMFLFGGMAYDILGANAGIMGAQAYADIKASDALTINTSAAYIETEEDNVADDDAFVLNFGGTYVPMANTKIVAHIQYADVDSAADNAISAGLGLKVNF